MKFVEIDYGEGVTLKGYLFEKSPSLPNMDSRPIVVVCPGGGYEHCSDREADPIALYFAGQGFNTFVFRYSVHEKAAFPQPLVELSRAVKDIRANGEKWDIATDRIAVFGFSAGAHLAASLGTLWNLPEVQEKSGCVGEENRPNALVLGYPVTNSRSWMASHIDRLVGDRDREQTIHLLNTDEQVGPHTPPAFIFHTYFDQVVAVEDSLCFANAMAKNNLPFELHIFTNGKHGMSLGNELVDFNEPEAAEWSGFAANWLWKLFGRPDKQPLTLDADRKHPVETVK